MKRRFLLALAAVVLSAQCAMSATVVGNMLDIFGNAAGTSVRFVPSGPLAIGTNTYLDYPRSARITNGLFSVWLAGGFYDADFVPYTLKPIRVLVWPGDTNTYTFNQAATLAVNAAMFNGSNLTVSVTLLTNELAYVPQFGAANLTNWAALQTNVIGTLYDAIQLATGSNGVSSFNTRVGAVALLSNDVVNALGYVPGTGSGSGQTNWDYTAITNAPWVTNRQEQVEFFSVNIPNDSGEGLVFVGETGATNLIVFYSNDSGIWAPTYFGVGTYLTDLNASALASGTVPLARLGTNTPTAGQVLASDATNLYWTTAGTWPESAVNTNWVYYPMTDGQTETGEHFTLSGLATAAGGWFKNANNLLAARLPGTAYKAVFWNIPQSQMMAGTNVTLEAQFCTSNSFPFSVAARIVTLDFDTHTVNQGMLGGGITNVTPEGTNFWWFKTNFTIQSTNCLGTLVVGNRTEHTNVAYLTMVRMKITP